MENLTFYPVSTELHSENYPYGFKLKTRKTDYLEFKEGKGFRHCSYTINPKTNRANGIKKGVYYDLLILTRNKENNHVKTIALSFNGNASINNSAKFIFNNFSLFEPEHIKYFAKLIISYSLVSIKANHTYCGAKLDELKPLFEPVIKTAVKIINTGENLFNEIKLDIEKIESLKIPNFNPFVTLHHTQIG